ncbi:MAG: glutamine synthetase [Bacteroidetes bacterium HGW-Bacteroidetes-4]|jgi:glutamine synthetase|nr:MAG: glutamine synthetase [Bacteroidetes bacterium HGW-Bacteroidetes-4]
MKNNDFNLSPDPLVRFLQKPKREFTKADIINYVEAQGIELINFRYVGGDGRLKTLNFVIQSREHLEQILSTGERVDGSSLFNFLETGSSDLYVVPRFKTAFLNPFSEIPAVDILCAYFDKSGNPLESAPGNIMRKAHRAFYESTGYQLEVMGEIEYYVISPKDDMYRATDQRGYHESAPFVKWEKLRTDALLAIAQTGAELKYGHSEVGNFCDDRFDYEQNEIEFLPTQVEDAADQLIIAKWILREVGYRYGVTVSLAPKITAGKAGSGMHIHIRPVKEGKNVTLVDGRLSDVAKKVIGGILDIAPALSAFGNPIPTSYYRLVPHQEAPTNVCWGERNRSTLIRVPLGWVGANDMVAKANPLEEPMNRDFSGKQTFELRSPDGSADIYLLLAGICVGARHGFEMPNGIEFANKTHVDVNIFDEKHKARQQSLSQLPSSCFEAAQALIDKADVFKQKGVFTDALIQGVARKLRDYNDQELRKNLEGNPEETMILVQRFLHCG